MSDKIFQMDCSNCNDPSCLSFSDKESSSEVFVKDFPAYPDSRTCVVDAIKYKNGKVFIDTQKCIFCGICQNRCNKGKSFLPPIFSKINDKFKTTQTNLKILFNGISHAKKSNMNFQNLLARNLLLTLGVSAKILKKGVISIRTDIMGKDFVGEVEFNDTGAGDILGIPRSLLDDVAVVCSRYGKDKDKFRKIAIVDKLPHIRSEYWEVIYDINNITDIKIETISILLLIAKVWAKSTNPSIERFNFYMDKNNLDYRRKIVSAFCIETDFSNIPTCEELDIVTQTK